MNDWRGVPIKAGDRVVYPGRHSSSMWTVEAEVVKLIEGTPEAESYWDRTPHMLRVKRLRENVRGKTYDVDPKEVLVQADNVTVVRTAEEIERDRYPIRYMVAATTGGVHTP